MLPGRPDPVALIITDDELTRLGLRVMLRQLSGVRNVVEATGPHDAAALAGADFDIAVVDAYRIGTTAAVALVDALAALRPGVAVALYTDDRQVLTAHCHARGVSCACFSRGGRSATALSQWLRKSLPIRGGSVATALNAPATPQADSVALLTDREREILTRVASGESSKGMAKALRISLRTVESHRAAICAKLGVRTVAELTKTAVKTGLSPL